MLLDPRAMWYALIPCALVRHAALLHKLTLAMLFALDELALKYVASRGNFTTSSVWNAFVPHAVVLLSVCHDHLAPTMSLSIGELALVHVTVLECELACTVRSPITLSAEINGALCCLYLSGFFCHSYYLLEYL